MVKDSVSEKKPSALVCERYLNLGFKGRLGLGLVIWIESSGPMGVILQHIHASSECLELLVPAGLVLACLLSICAQRVLSTYMV